MFKGAIVALITTFKNNMLDVESYISLISNGVICGLGMLGYEIAIDAVSLK